MGDRERRAREVLPQNRNNRRLRVLGTARAKIKYNSRAINFGNIFFRSVSVPRGRCSTTRPGNNKHGNGPRSALFSRQHEALFFSPSHGKNKKPRRVTITKNIPTTVTYIILRPGRVHNLPVAINSGFVFIFQINSSFFFRHKFISRRSFYLENVGYLIADFVELTTKSAKYLFNRHFS